MTVPRIVIALVSENLSYPANGLARRARFDERICTSLYKQQVKVSFLEFRLTVTFYYILIIYNNKRFMNYINNFSAFLWTDTAAYKGKPYALTVADLMLSQGRIFSKAFNTVITFAGVPCGTDRSRISVLGEIFLGYSVAILAEKTHPSLAIISYIFSSLFVKAICSMSPFLSTEMLGYCFIPALLIQKQFSLLAKCFLSNLLIGSVLKTIVWYKNSDVQQIYNRYLKNKEYDLNFTDADSKAFPSLCGLPNDIMSDEIVKCSSSCLIKLRLINKEWHKAITMEQVLKCKIQENFSKEFIDIFGLERLFNLMQLNPLPRKSISFSYDSLRYSIQYEEIRRINWGKTDENEFFISIRTGIEHDMAPDIYYLRPKFFNSINFVYLYNAGFLPVTNFKFKSDDITSVNIKKEKLKSGSLSYKCNGDYEIAKMFPEECVDFLTIINNLFEQSALPS